MNIKLATCLTAVSFSTLYLIGCASAYSVNVTASPAGAVISYHNGQVVGEAPVTLNYNADPNYMSGGCLRAAGVTATWTSGAQAKSAAIIRLCQQGMVHHVRLNRPHDAPGLDVDLRIAALRAEQKMIQQQALIEEAGKTAGALGALIGRNL